jgi:hypothetical protein
MHSREVWSRRAFLRAGAFAAAGVAAGCAAPSPSPEGTTPAAAPLPTGTPLPVATVAPTSTATPPPTVTLEPTATTPPPTATPEPSATLSPTPASVLATAREPTATLLPPTATPASTHTPTPAATTPIVRPSRSELIAHYPGTAQSVVSAVRHAGVWDGEQIQVHVVLQMLDAAITQLTGLQDALAAWGVLFDPGEVIGIKVNTISRYTTTPTVAYAVAQRLQDTGISAEQIILFDRTDRELGDRGFTINADGPGVRCRGAKAWEQPAQVAGSTQRIHDVILGCSALINVPPLKEHSISGFTSAMKNHYGSVDSPGRLHGNSCDPYIPELNALPVIRDKTRLIVGDLLRTCPYDWNRMIKEDTIAMSFDPLAYDRFARQMLVDRREADKRPGPYITALSHYLDTAFAIGLGADREHTEVRRAVLG